MARNDSSRFGLSLAQADWNKRVADGSNLLAPSPDERPQNMRTGSPLQTLHEALASALHRDLPDIEYETRDWEAERALNQGKLAGDKTVIRKLRKATRRPESEDVDVLMFSQTWGSTALGYGGLGGAAMTSAYTVVVEGLGWRCVYFGCGRLAYKIEMASLTDEQREAWRQAVVKQWIPSRQEAVKSFNAQVPSLA